MRTARKSAPVNATACPQVTITIAPDVRRGRYRAYLETEQEMLCTSRQPFFDSARKLIARGHGPQTMLIMRWQGAEGWALRGPLGVAAKLTLDEHNGSFAKWKSLSRSAVPSQITKSTDRVAEASSIEKRAGATTAEKRKRTPLTEQLNRGPADVR
jgi:hypothetical protein